MKILLVEDNLADAKFISQMSNEEDWHKFHLKHVKQLTEAVDTLSQDFDAILLNLSLIDAQGITSLNIVRQKAPRSAIIILTTTNKPKIAIQCMRQGAQDYLIKGELTRKILTRSIQYAIERQRYQFHLCQQASMKQMLDKIRNSINLEAILSTTATEIQQYLQCDRVLIYRRESTQSEAITVFSQSIDGKSDYSSSNFANESWFNSLMQSILAESTSISAIEDTSIVSQELQIVPQTIRSYLILPIWLSESVEHTYDNLISAAEPEVSGDFHEELWGMLVAYNISQTRKWRDWEIDFTKRLTTQVTIAISQSQLCCQLQTANQKLQQLAILDGLTGIANRRYFDLVLNKEWQRLAREQQPLSLILCDLDYFKAYNDAYGHQQGDLCLQKIALLLRQAARRSADLAARYGGEEFALILPNTDSQGALFVAHKIMHHLAEGQIPHQKSEVSDFVTFSIGVTTKIPRPKQPAMTIIETADKLLYRAKAEGRNRLATDSKHRS